MLTDDGHGFELLLKRWSDVYVVRTDVLREFRGMPCVESSPFIEH